MDLEAFIIDAPRRNPARRRYHRFLVIVALAILLGVSAQYVLLTDAPIIGVVAAAGRDPFHQPFSRDSIWNLPIGFGAQYVWAGIQRASAMAYFTDADVLIMEPTAPATTVYTSYDDWGGGSRCASQGPALFTAPIPSDFTIPGSHQGSPDGDTPNSATAILSSDGHTLIQTQPFARCAGSAPTSHYVFGTEDLYGTGETGSHGGSGLSALGGTVRLGELVPGGRIPHALKLNLDAINFYGGLGGFRWPAWKSDAGGAGYNGPIPQVRMGSLLALRPDFTITNLETEQGRIVAQAFQDFGGYIVDTSGWSIYNFVTERSPDGSVQDEFQQAWGHPLNTAPGANGWARDLDSIFTSLWAVDNWDRTIWQVVSASAGTLGVGLGLPLVSWALDFGQEPPSEPPITPPTPPPTPPPPPPPPASDILSADFTWDATGFHAGAWNGRAPYRFLWMFGDGSLTSWSDATDVNHVFAAPGLYRVTLITADTGSSVFVIKDVQIP
jgi:hypothetical protein